jgi:hypothetical protein
MFDYISGGTLAVSIALSAIAIVLCVAQIRLRDRIKFYELCKVTVYIPLLSIVIRALTGSSQALVAIAEANDLNSSIMHRGIAALLSTISLGLLLTISLSVVYAVTVAICENKSR